MNTLTSALSVLAAFTALFSFQPTANAQAVALGSAAGFEVLAGSGITVAGASGSTSITGDIGTFPTLTLTGLGNIVLTGTNHGGDATTQAAKASLDVAYATAAGTAATTTYAPIKDLGGLTLTPGVYNDPTSFAITGLLRLDALGDANAVWIFQAGSTLTAATGSEVRLVNGAQASNVFWQVGSSATINSTATFKGTILALTSISLVTGATVEGRLLARNGFVALDTNSLTLPAVPLTAQTITFAAIPAHTACDVAFTVAPTASSGLPVTLVVTSGPATVIGNLVTLTGTGTVVLTTSQAGNGTFSAAPNVVQSFTVTACVVPLTPQTITFAAIPAHTACDTAFTVAPTASSGLPVTLVVTSGPATVAGNTVTLTGTGTVVLTTSQAGNGTFSAAPNVVQSFTVTACVVPLTPQTITFAAIPTHTACDVAFTVAPTASSGLPVTLVVTSGPATVAGNTVTLTGTGTVVLTTSQAGNGTFSAAPNVVQSFTVTACVVPLTPQTITFAAIPAHTACDTAFTVAPTATSGLPVTLVVTSGPATVAGNTVTLTGTGTVVLTTSQAGNGTFSAAPNVVQSFAVTACVVPLTPQTITFAAIPTHTACDTAFTVAPTASSGLPVTLVVTSGPATVAGTTVTLTGTGTVVLTTSQAGNGTFSAAPNVVQSFTVTACVVPLTPQTITFAAIPAHTACDVAFTVAPTASSGLPVTLVVTSGPATVAGNTVTLTGTGTVVLTTSQAGNGTFSAAPNVVQSFAVAACVVPPVITSPYDVQIGGIAVAPNIQSGVVGTPFAGYQITSTGSPTSFGALNLPPGLTLDTATGKITGTPTVSNRWWVTVQANNAAGTGDAPVIFEISPVAFSRIVNFSARAFSGPGSQALVLGFVIAGSEKEVMVRAVGPTLSAFSVPNVLADPLLTLFRGNTAVATNDDWQNGPSGVAITAASLRVGAFPLPVGSKDSAVLLELDGGPHSASLVRPNGASGIGLVEVYQSDTNPAARLVNASARVLVGLNENAVAAGFVIQGNLPKTVLLRGVGPTLSVFGVTGLLADPQLAVFSSTAQIAANNDWSTTNAAPIAAAAAQVGAFALPVGSKDAAVLLTLEPGAYSVILTGVGATTGVALIEIYEVL